MGQKKNPSATQKEHRHMRTKRIAKKDIDIVIVGGLGHVGLPLGLVFAQKDLDVLLYDIDARKADLVKKGVMPFIEYGANPILKKVIANDRLQISADMKSISRGRYVIIALGTPLDEYN